MGGAWISTASILKFRGVDTLDEYLQRVDELLTPPEVVDAAPAIPSPFDLAAALDYFNTVWQLHFDRKRSRSSACSEPSGPPNGLALRRDLVM